MKRLRTVPSRGAALACFAIGIVYAVGIFSSPSVVYALLGGAGAVVAALTGAKMWFHNCFESHLAAMLLVVAAVISTLLYVTVGLPGGDSGALSALHVVVVVLSVVVVVLLVMDGRVRREHRRRTRRSYAQ